MAFATLSGTISRDAEQRFTPNNNMVTNFTMHVTRWDGRAKQEKTYPVKITLWGEAFGQMLNQLREGTRVIAAGRLQIDKFNDKEGKPVTLAAMEASSINIINEMLEGAAPVAAMASNEDPNAGIDFGFDNANTGGASEANDQEIPF